MKVLQLNCVYGTGSTGRLVQQLHTAMEAQGIESVVLYGRGPSTAEVLIQVTTLIPNRTEAAKHLTQLPKRLTTDYTDFHRLY